MHSLPNYPSFPHLKIKFSTPIQKPGISLQSTPCEQEDLNFTSLQKREIFNFQQFRKRKNSNILEWMILNKKEKKIFFCILKKIVVPNFLAFLFIFLIIIFENNMHLNCYEEDKMNKFEFSYFVLRNTLFSSFFFNWLTGLCLFEEKSQKVVNVFMFFGVLTITFILKYRGVYLIIIGNLNLDVFFFPFLFQLILYLSFKKYQKNIGKKQILRIVFVIIFFLIGFFDHLIIRQYLLRLVYISLQDIQNKKMIFQCFLFVLYQIYGKIFLKVFIKFKEEFGELISKNLLIFSIKYCAINVLSSCIVLPVVKQDIKYAQIFAIVNFLAQLISFSFCKKTYFCTIFTKFCI